MNHWLSWAVENVPPELVGAALTTLIGFVTIHFLAGIRRRRFLKGAAEMLACKLIDAERIIEELNSTRIKDDRVVEIARNPIYIAVLSSAVSDIRTWNARAHEFIESGLIVRLNALDHLLNLCEIDIHMNVEYLRKLQSGVGQDQLLKERIELLDIQTAYGFRKVSDASRYMMLEYFKLGGFGKFRLAIKLLGELSEQSLESLSLAT